MLPYNQYGGVQCNASLNIKCSNIRNHRNNLEAVLRKLCTLFDEKHVLIANPDFILLLSSFCPSWLFMFEPRPLMLVNLESVIRSILSVLNQITWLNIFYEDSEWHTQDILQMRTFIPLEWFVLSVNIKIILSLVSVERL